MKASNVDRIIELFPELKIVNKEQSYVTGMAEGSEYAISVTVRYDTNIKQIIHFQEITGASLFYRFDTPNNSGVLIQKLK